MTVIDVERRDSKAPRLWMFAGVAVLNAAFVIMGMAGQFEEEVRTLLSAAPASARQRQYSGHKFNNNILPSFICRIPDIDALFPGLCSHDI